MNTEQLDSVVQNIDQIAHIGVEGFLLFAVVVVGIMFIFLAWIAKHFVLINDDRVKGHILNAKKIAGLEVKYTTLKSNCLKEVNALRSDATRCTKSLEECRDELKRRREQ